MNVERVLGQLKGVVQTTPHTWKALCPAHEDKNPSLSITQDGEKLLLHCHAGCSFDAVLGAAGISMEDCGATTIGNKFDIVATYDYFDDGGKFAYQVRRRRDKSFRQFSKDENGKWVPNIKGVVRTIYKLPELTQARGSQVVFIVEGEKDVDRLFSLGFLATTNSGGAGKWQARFGRYLKGRDVIIIPDNDKPGKEHADQLVVSLEGKAASVRVLELPEQGQGADVSDWLNKGNTPKLLKELANKAGLLEKPAGPVVTTFSGTDLMAMKLPPQRFLIPGILPEGLALLVGPPKVGKSWFCLDLMLSLSRGVNALGNIPVEQCDVLYLALEDNHRCLQERLGLLLDGEDCPPGLHFKLEWPRLDPQSGGLVQLEDFIRQNPSVHLIIIDTLGRVKPEAERGKPSYDIDTKATAPLQGLAGRYQKTILVVHHDRKMAADDPLDAVSGTKGLTGVADTIMILKRGNSKAKGELYITGRDVQERRVALGRDVDHPTWVNLGELEHFNVDEHHRLVMEALRESPSPLGPTAIAEATKLNINTVKKLIKRMMEKDEICKAEYGKYTDHNPNPAVQQNLVPF